MDELGDSRWNAGIGLLPTYASLLYDNLVPVVPSVRHSFPVFLCFERSVANRLNTGGTGSDRRTERALETVFDRNLAGGKVHKE